MGWNVLDEEKPISAPGSSYAVLDAATRLGECLAAPGRL